MRALASLFLSFLSLGSLSTPGCAGESKELRLDAARAFEHLKNQVAFGPRLPGTVAHEKTRAYLLAELRSYGLQAEEIAFIADTPKGKLSMANVVATLAGKRKDAVVIGSHFDTKDIGTPPCPGANDGASSTALLLEMARALAAQGTRSLTYRFVFFDGEEALVDWSEADSLYGSRDLVARWSKDGSIASIKAMILLDLVGDKDLSIARESLSSGWLVQAIAEAAKELGHERYFFRNSESIEDDHRPFLQAGIPAIDLIDTSYGPKTMTNGLGAFWHTAQDTVENCSPESLRIVGETVLRALPKIEKRILP